MRLEGFVQQWVRPDIAVRLSVTYATEYEAIDEPPIITDTTKVTRLATQESTDLRFGGEACSSFIRCKSSICSRDFKI